VIEIKRKVQVQGLAIKEYESWLNMLLGMISDTEYKDYAIRIKEVRNFNQRVWIKLRT
jgi:hypothetical protein